MSRLPLLDATTAPEASQPFVQKALANNGFVPNLIAVLAHAPAALETYLTVSGINATSALSLAEREVVQLTAAKQHGCDFCLAGHTAIGTKKAGFSREVALQLQQGLATGDARLDAVQTFTKAVIATRGAVDDAQLAAFKAAGFTGQHALEVVLGVSLATLCNFANNLGQPSINPELQPFAPGVFSA